MEDKEKEKASKVIFHIAVEFLSLLEGGEITWLVSMVARKRQIYMVRNLN